MVNIGIHIICSIRCMQKAIQAKRGTYTPVQVWPESWLACTSVRANCASLFFCPIFWGNPLMPCRVWIGASFPIYHQKILFRRLETFWSWKTSNFCGSRAVPRDPLKKRAVFGGAKNLIEFLIKLLDHQPVCQKRACNIFFSRHMDNSMWSSMAMA